jgi:hypothetical protein
MRKVIQISTTSPFYSEGAVCPAGVYALCDDGSIWEWVNISEGTQLLIKGEDGKDKLVKAPPPHWERFPGPPAEDAKLKPIASGTLPAASKSPRGSIEKN